MKNIHILPTDKPSRLFITDGKLFNYHKPQQGDGVKIINQHIYITSDEEIKEGGWVFDTFKNACPIIRQLTIEEEVLEVQTTEFKIILTTDQDLIKDGVQAIDNDFLEWFVKNPSCEKVDWFYSSLMKDYEYEIIIPNEEPKQETLEEVAERILLGEDLDLSDYDKRYIFKAMVNIAKWQQERMYSEEDMKIAWNEAQKLKMTECMANGKDKKCYCTNEIHCQHKRLIKFSEWFEQFKNK